MIAMYEYLVGQAARLRRDDEGQTLVEYALILAFVSILSIAALTVLSNQINAVLSAVSSAL